MVTFFCVFFVLFDAYYDRGEPTIVVAFSEVSSIWELETSAQKTDLLEKDENCHRMKNVMAYGITEDDSK